MLPPAAGAAGVERQFLPDHTMDDVDDPDLGAAAMEDAVVGDNAEPGGTGLNSGFKDCRMMPKSKSPRVASRRLKNQGAGSSTAPVVSGGAQKRRAASILFGSRPKKSNASTTATKRDEAAAKAARFRKAVKQPQAVSA